MLVSPCAQTPLSYTSSALGLYPEDGPPTDIADRISASFPHFMSIGLAQRSARRIEELDRFVHVVSGFSILHPFV